MIYTSYFGKMKRFPPGAFCISIARFKPTWYTGFECTALAPSQELLFKYKEDSDKDFYIKEFTEYLSTKNPIKFTNMILEKAKRNDVFLLCYERPVEFCHRHLVREWLNKAGVKCEEFSVENQPPWEE